jgi:hypothetical protein
VVEVWFLKKRTKKDGFEKFHYDFGLVRGELNDVSSTIVVNLGVFHKEDKEEKIYNKPQMIAENMVYQEQDLQACV